MAAGKLSCTRAKRDRRKPATRYQVVVMMNKEANRNKNIRFLGLETSQNSTIESRRGEFSHFMWDDM